MQKLRLGFVGGGRGLVASWHVTGARLANNWEVVAGALSSNPEIALSSGKEWGLAADRIYTDFHTMAEQEAKRSDGIDAVAIVTPNDSHYPISKAFMEAGIDVICDKPLTTTLADAMALQDLQQQTGLILALTHPYVYHATARQAREMIQAGAIGKVRQLQVEYAQDWATGPDPAFASWRRDPAKVGPASAVGDIGTHAMHLAHFITGLTVTDLRAEFHVCGAPKNMEDTAYISMRFENGAPGMMWVSQAAPGNACGLRIRVYGEKGGIEWDQEKSEYLRVNYLDQPQQIIVRGHGAGMLPAAERLINLPRGHGESLSDAWGNMYREIGIAITARRNGETIPNDLQYADVTDGVRGVKFVEAAAQSHATGGKWVKCAI